MKNISSLPSVILLVTCALSVEVSVLNAQPVDPLTNGLVAHYTFNSSYSDVSGNGSSAIPFNQSNLSFAYDSLLNRSVLSIVGEGFMNSSGGYVKIPRPTGLGSVATIAINIMEIGYSQWHGMDFIGAVDSGGSGLGLIGHLWFRDPNIVGLYGMGQRIESSVPSFTLTNGGESVLIDSPVWTSYQIVSDGSSTELYRNGLLLSEVLATIPASGDFYLNYGEFEGNTLTRLTANYSDVRVYDRALTSTEVQDLAAAVVPEPSTYALLLLSGAASVWLIKKRRR